MLWLGDNVYFREPEWTSPEGMSARYRAYRQLPALQRLWRSTAHVAIWDDHDYGPNDGDASFVMKGAALETFRRYWPNPTQGLPGVPGIFTKVRVADADFFLLDDRWYRYPNRYPNVPEKALLGAQQLEWLKQALLTSSATFKVVAMGTQFWNRVSRFETWQNYPDEQQKLRDWLREQRIAGVVFLSGDRHFSELLRLPREGTYPLYEFTSSPLTAGVVTNPDEQERSNPDLVSDTLVTQRNFGMLRLAGPKGNRTLGVRELRRCGNAVVAKGAYCGGVALTGGARDGASPWQMPPAQHLGGVRDGRELALGDQRGRHGIVGEGGEAAVGIEQHALGAEQMRIARSACATISSTDSTRRMLLVDHADADARDRPAATAALPSRRRAACTARGRRCRRACARSVGSSGA